MSLPRLAGEYTLGVNLLVAYAHISNSVLNLFSRDIYVVDQILARVIQNLCRTLAVCLGIVVVIGASFPPFLIAVFPLSWFYLRVMKCASSF